MRLVSGVKQSSAEKAEHSWPRRLLVGTLAGVGLVLAVAVLGGATVLGRGPKSGSTMRLVSEVNVAGTGQLVSGTDYATVRGGTLYVAYSSANSLLAFDMGTGTLRTWASGLPGVHGIAFSDAPALAAASVGGTGEIAVMPDSGSSPRRIVPAGQDPDGIVYDRHAGVFYAGNGKSDSATLVSVTDLDHPFTVPLGGSPEFPQVDESDGLIYQPLEDTNEIAIVDPVRHQVVSRLPIAPCTNPHGAAMDQEHRVLFLGCFNHLLAVLDLKTARVTATVPIGRFVDVVAWDAGLRRVYTANAAGSMTVVEQSGDGTYRVIDTVSTRAGGHTLAVDPRTHRVYVVCSGFRARIIVYEPLPTSALQSNSF